MLCNLLHRKKKLNYKYNKSYYYLGNCSGWVFKKIQVCILVFGWSDKNSLQEIHA